MRAFQSDGVVADEFFPFTANTTVDFGVLHFGRSVLTVPNTGHGRLSKGTTPWGGSVWALVVGGVLALGLGIASRKQAARNT